jgi:hypothetical protein
MGAIRRYQQRKRARLAKAAGANLDDAQADPACARLETSLALSVGAGARRESGTMKMIRRALREEWPLTAEQRRVCIDFAMRVIANGEPRSGLAAISALIAADNINAKREAGDVHARGQDVQLQAAALDALARDHPDLYAQLLAATLAKPTAAAALPAPVANGKPTE